jgi:hypothetical protein
MRGFIFKRSDSDCPIPPAAPSTATEYSLFVTITDDRRADAALVARARLRESSTRRSRARCAHRLDKRIVVVVVADIVVADIGARETKKRPSVRPSVVVVAYEPLARARVTTVASRVSHHDEDIILDVITSINQSVTPWMETSTTRQSICR